MNALSTPVQPVRKTHRRRKALRRGLFKLFAWLAIGLALLVALLKLALPLIAQQPDWIAARLSDALGVKVELAGAQSNLHSKLELELHELKIGDALSLNRAYARLDPLGFLPGRVWLKSLRVERLRLQLLETELGWQLSGFGETRPMALPDWRALLKRIGQVSLANAELNLRGKDGRTLQFNNVAAALSRSENTYHLGLRLALADRTGLEKLAPAISGQLAQRDLELNPGLDKNYGRLEGVLHWQDVPTQPIDSYFKLIDLQSEGFSQWLPEPVRALNGALNGQLWLAVEHTDGRYQTRRASFNVQAAPLLPQDGGTLFASEPVTLLGQTENGEHYRGVLRFMPTPASQARGKTLPSTSKADSASGAQTQTIESNWAMYWPSAPGARAIFELEQIDIARIAGALQGFLAFAPAKSLTQAAPSGEISRLRLNIDRAQASWNMQLNARQLAIKPSNWGERPQLPGVAGLNLELIGNSEAFSISATAEPLRFSEPLRFKRTLQSAKFSANGAFWQDAGGWQLDLPNMQLDDPDFKASIGVNVQAAANRFDWPKDSPNRAPQLDFSLALARGNVARARDFWDKKGIAPKLIDWLENALVSGKVVSGTATMRTPIMRKQFPFKEHQGLFETHFRVEQTALKFAADWPEALIQSDVSMRNDQLLADNLSGEIAGNQISTARAEIADFKAPWLDLTLEGTSNADALLSLIRQTPIGARYGKNFAELNLLGPTRTTLALGLPLKAGLAEKTLKGSTLFEGVALNNEAWRLALSDLHGELSFDMNGFHSSVLKGANLLQSQAFSGSGALANADPKSAMQLAPVSLRAAVGESHTGHTNQLVRVSLSGPMSAKILFDDVAVLKPIVAASSGVADWQILSITERRGEANENTLELQSNLQGIALDLPAPLGKSVDEVRPLIATVPIEANSRRDLTLHVDGSASFRARLANATFPFQGVLSLGPNQGPDSAQLLVKLPRSGLALRGSLQEPNWQAWGSLAAAIAAASPASSLGSEQTGQFLRDVDIALPDSDAPERAARLKLAPEQDGWQADITSEKVSGTLRYRSQAGSIAQLEAQFDRLYLAAPEASGAERSLTESGAEPQVLPTIAEPKTALASNMSPALLPALHIYIKDFAFGQARLGETRLETFPVDGGLRVDLLSSKSELLALNATGTWLARGVGSQSQFNMRFTAEDLGKMLTGLGFAGHVGGGQTSVQIDANWNGPPQAFSWLNLQGTMKIWVGSGRFLEISPGAGRIFGLLSLQELPRRLALDFRDFFQSGMSFNEIAGTFLFNGGNAYTQDLRIKAPAADILVTGRTGMAARDYQQTARVSPKVGLLPIVGAVAAGPAGVAAGLLAQNVLERESAFSESYEIAGSWEKPEVKKLKPAEVIRAQR